MHIAQLRERQIELAALGADVLVVTFEAGPVACAYMDETQLPWPVVVDPDRSLYHAYGMMSARWIDLIGPRVIWLYLKLMFRGGRVRMPTGDTSQLGGNVIVDPQGIVRLHHVAVGPAGRPTVESLLELIRRESPSTADPSSPR
ncbi:MAG: peroxiredoxin-like family protein [Pirellulales bacterium]